MARAAPWISRYFSASSTRFLMPVIAVVDTGAALQTQPVGEHLGIGLALRGAGLSEGSDTGPPPG